MFKINNNIKDYVAINLFLLPLFDNHTKAIKAILVKRLRLSLNDEIIRFVVR